MSVLNWGEPDSKRWNAKLVGERAHQAQVEIRHRFGNAPVVIIVTLYGGYEHTSHTLGNLTREDTKGYQLHFSSSGPMQMTWMEYHEMLAAIDEAKKKLEELEINQTKNPLRLLD